MLEAAVATLFSIVTLLSLMGGRAHLRSDIGRLKVNLYYISTLFLLCSMLALVYTNDIFTAYVFVEINTITACGIVMSKEDGPAYEKGDVIKTTDNTTKTFGFKRAKRK